MNSIFKTASEETPRRKRNINDWFVVFPRNVLMRSPLATRNHRDVARFVDCLFPIAFPTGP